MGAAIGKIFRVPSRPAGQVMFKIFIRWWPFVNLSLNINTCGKFSSNELVRLMTKYSFSNLDENVLFTRLTQEIRKEKKKTEEERNRKNIVITYL